MEKERLSGQVSLFGSAKKDNLSLQDKLPQVKEFPMAELLKNEKELLGVYLTDHPIKALSNQISNRLTHKLNQIDKSMKGQSVSIAGIIASLRIVNTKKNNSRMAFANLEDEFGKVNIVIFPKLFKETSNLWKDDQAVFITGRVDDRNDELSIIVEKVEELSKKNSIPPSATLEIPRGTDKKIMLKISQLLKLNPGNQTISIIIKNHGNDKIINLPYKVDFSTELQDKISRLLC